MLLFVSVNAMCLCSTFVYSVAVVCVLLYFFGAVQLGTGLHFCVGYFNVLVHYCCVCVLLKFIVAVRLGTTIPFSSRN